MFRFSIYKAYSDQVDAVVLRVKQRIVSLLQDEAVLLRGSFLKRLFTHLLRHTLAHKQHRSEDVGLEFKLQLSMDLKSALWLIPVESLDRVMAPFFLPRYVVFFTCCILEFFSFLCQRLTVLTCRPFTSGKVNA